MDSRLSSMEGCRAVLDELFAKPQEEFGGTDIAVLNLLCAIALPGSENLNILQSLAHLDSLSNYIAGSIERTYRAYGPSPDYNNCPRQTKMAILVTRMKQEFGVSYHPQAKADLEAGINAPYNDASEMFIHGMLHDDKARRWGTCSSIPVLVTAIARRLGFPVRLACAREHLYCRWEDEEASFNVEASNAMGMAVESDEQIRQFRGGFPAELEKDGFHFRSLSPAEEFAVFMKSRVAVLRDAARYDETFVWSARALQYSPEDWVFIPHAYNMMDWGLKNRLRLKHPEFKIQEGYKFRYPIYDLLLPHEWPLIQTINGHCEESIGLLDFARNRFETACRMNHQGHNEQRDLQRFLKKHHLSPRAKQRSIPKNMKTFRRYKVECRAGEEIDMLRRLADECEAKGELLQARDALHDLYLYNPCHAEVFDRARGIEKQPRFHEQLAEAQNAGIEHVDITYR